MTKTNVDSQRPYKTECDNQDVISSPKINRIYIIYAKSTVGQSSAAVNSSSDKFLIWHKRLSHIFKKLIILNKLGCIGNDNTGKLDFCEDYVIVKQKRLPFKTRIHKSNSILNYLHADLQGPTSVNILSEFKFYLLIVDDFSRKI